MASIDFKTWWGALTENCDNCATMERLAALEAWDHQQKKIDRLEKENKELRERYDNK